MIDGFKTILSNNLDAIRYHPLLDFVIPYSEKTGEIKKGKYPTAEYKGLKFIDKGSIIEITGSLQKFKNEGKHNYDEFTFEEIWATINILQNELNIDINHARLTNVEIGINLTLDYDPDIFLRSLVMHRGKKFTFQQNWNMQYRECIHYQFFIKIYNKGLQYQLNKYVLRIEIKYRKMEKPNSIGIHNISDLLDVTKIKKLKDELLKIYDDILIGDYNLDPNSLSSKDQLLFEKGHHPDFWDKLLPKSEEFKNNSDSSGCKKMRKKYERNLSRFKYLLKKTGANYRKEYVRNLIVEKSAKLLKTSPQVTTHISKSAKKKGEIDRPKSTKIIQSDKKTNKEKKGEIDVLFYSVNLPKTDRNNIHSCKVTNLDISMQKQKSEYLCTEGVRFYKKYYPEIYLKLWQRLSEKWHGCSEEIQIREIHHSVRNEYNNPIHNTRKGIDKLTATPALFNQFDLISKEKLRIAGLAS
jgi:hypothetical protein